MRFHKLHILFLLLLPLNLFSQAFSPPLRLEIEVPTSEFPFHVVPFDKNGVALLYETEVSENKKVKWSIVLFDTNLQKISTTDLWLENDLTVEVINSDQNNLFLCFQKPTRRSTSYNTYFVHYFLPERKAKVYALNLKDREEVIDLSVIGETALYASVYNQNEKVYTLNLKSLEAKPLYPEKDVMGIFQFFKTDTLDNAMWIASTYYTHKTNSTLLLTELNVEGNIIKNMEVPFDENYRLNYFRMIQIDPHNQLLVGTYVNANEYNAIKSEDNINTGVFSMIISNGIAEKAQYYNFLILSTQVDRKKTTMTTKDASLNLQLVLDEIVRNDSLNVFIGEVIYPEYRQEYAANYGMYGYTTAPTSVFAGYRYQIAYVLSFTNKGELAWNTQLQYNDVLVKSLRNILHAYLDVNNDVLLFYGVGSEIISIVLNGRTVVQSTESLPVEMLSPTDRIVTQYTTTLKHWYKNYFIYYGYQTVSGSKNNKKSTRRRNVLFINKMVYR